MNGSTVKNQGWVKRNLKRANASPSSDASGDDEVTEELPTRQPPASNKGSGFVPGLTGIVMLILVIMAAGMVVAQLVSGGDTQPGPGTITVTWHVVAAVAGIVCYRFSRRKGPGQLLALLAILVIAVLVLWFFWWSPG
jgi:hypothetical protein